MLLNVALKILKKAANINALNKIFCFFIQKELNKYLTKNI